MPLAAGSVDARLQQILNKIVTVSQDILVSAPPSVNSQNYNAFANLHLQLETIRTSANAIFVAFTKASVTDYAIDDRLMDWLLSGEPSSCLDKLKEMDEMMKPASQSRPTIALARPGRVPKDMLTAAMAFFDKHKGIFHFLLTPDIWNHERHPHHQAQVPQLTVLPPTEGAQHDPRGKHVIPSSQEKHPSDKAQTTKIRWEKLDEALRWLSAFNCTEKHNGILKLRQEGTCRWFPNTNAYGKWRFKTDRFLWLHGKAGCGKSVLVASTIEHLKTTLRHGEVMVYFYFDFQNERSSTSAVMMRSLLSQLLCHFRNLSIDPEAVPDKILDGKSKGTLSLDDPDQMCDLVLRAVNCFLWYPLIVIDALDECADIKVLLPVLDKLKLDDVRLLVTSRPYEDTMSRFVRLQSLSFQDVAKDVASDIALHVIREIDSHKELRAVDAKIKNEICQQLNGKAEGRFRWVQCQLDALKQCASGAELKEALENLPNELETMYERILGKIDERRTEGRLAQRTLVWLVVAMKPLHMAQIADGLLFDTKQEEISYKSQDLHTFLLNLLSSLVSYSERTDVLSLSHFSVKEYLTTSSRIALRMYYVVPHVAHADMAQMCIRYLSVFLEQEKHINDYVVLLKSFPMLSYVLCHGFDHMIHVQSSSIVVLKGLESLRADIHHHPTHWDRLCKLREEEFRWPYPSWPSSRHDIALYILIAYSSPDLLRAYLSSHRPLQLRVGTNALVYATDLRKTEHAIALLTYGTNMDKAGLMIDDSCKSLPIDVAIDAGNDTLVGEFLERGSALSPETISTAVCMPWCTIHVLAKIMQTENFANWAKEIGNERLYRAIFNSARPCAGDSKKADEDHVTLAHRLRELGVDLSPDSRFGSELIERALHAAHTSMLDYLLPRDQPPPSRFLLTAATGDTSETVAVVRFLLRRGANINVTTNGSRDTALHLAVMCPWEPRSLELIQEMINAGGDPLVLNRRGETPLTIAMKREYINAVVYILSCKALPPDRLSTTLRNDLSPRMVDLIIRAGANMKWIASNGYTFLHLTISMYNEPTSMNLLKMLIAAGCDPTACNPNGKTIMEAAAKRGYASVVEQLFLCSVQAPPNIILIALRSRFDLRIIDTLVRGGASAKSIASNGDTALHLAVSEYDESMSLTLVRMFIKAGCDPTARNSNGKTAMEAAIERSYGSVVEQLCLCNMQLPPNIILIALQSRPTPQIIDTLVHGGANVKSVASNGDTALHLAISKYDESMSLALTKRLIDAGCDPTTCDSKGKTAIEVAIDHGYVLVVEYLLLCDMQLPLNILPTALRRRSTPLLVENLIRGGANVKCIASNGDTVLHLTISKYDQQGSLTLVRRFIAAGCDPTTRNFKGETAMEVAVKRGYRSIVEQLLLSNVPLSPNIIPTAVQNGATPWMIEFLICKGANVNSTTSNGDTILHIVIAKYSEYMCLYWIKKLILAGCDLMTHVPHTVSILEAVVKRGYTMVTHYLLFCIDPLPPAFDLLSEALQCRCIPQVIRLLVDRPASDLAIISQSQWDTLLELARTASYSERDLVLVLEMLLPHRKGKGRMT